METDALRRATSTFVSFNALKYLPEHRNRPERIHPANQTSDKNRREEQQAQRQNQQPHQKKRDPEPERVATSIGNADHGYKGDHCNASISRIASCAPISPRFKRSSISARDGTGSISTNSSIWATRFRRDLIVG